LAEGLARAVALAGVVLVARDLVARALATPGLAKLGLAERRKAGDFIDFAMRGLCVIQRAQSMRAALRQPHLRTGLVSESGLIR
jgi:hypothetical protein